MDKTFQDLQPGDKVIVRKVRKTEGVEATVAARSSSKYGFKLRVSGDGGTWSTSMPEMTSSQVAEWYDEKNRYLYTVKQPAKRSQRKPKGGQG